MVRDDAIAQVRDDAGRLFGFRKGESHQERCHAYCRDHGIMRAWNEPATEAVVMHLVERAYSLGCRDTRLANPVSADLAACELELVAQELADRAAELRGA